MEGTKKIEAGRKLGDYTVTFDAKKKVSRADLEGAIGDFTLEKAELTIAGDAEKGEKGLALAATSGAKYALCNREKKDDEDKVPDVVAKLEGFLKDGKKTVRVSGALTADGDGNQTVHLESAEVVEKKDKK